VHVCAPAKPCIDITSFAYRNRSSELGPARTPSAPRSTKATVAVLAPGNRPPSVVRYHGTSRRGRLLAGNWRLPHAAGPDKIPSLQLVSPLCFLRIPPRGAKSNPPSFGNLAAALPSSAVVEGNCRFSRRAAWYFPQDCHLPILREPNSVPNWDHEEETQRRRAMAPFPSPIGLADVTVAGTGSCVARIVEETNSNECLEEATQQRRREATSRTSNGGPHSAGTRRHSSQRPGSSRKPSGPRVRTLTRLTKTPPPPSGMQEDGRGDEA
jgi:hypothetical protein